MLSNNSLYHKNIKYYLILNICPCILCQLTFCSDMTSYLVFYGFNVFQLCNLSRIQIKIIHIMGEMEYSHMHVHWMLVHKHTVQKNIFFVDVIYFCYEFKRLCNWALNWNINIFILNSGEFWDRAWDTDACGYTPTDRGEQPWVSPVSSVISHPTEAAGTPYRAHICRLWQLYLLLV